MFYPKLFSLLRKHKWILIILTFACLLRFWGIQFGLPYQYHPDEIKYVLLGLKVGVVGPNIGYFDNPTGFVYLLFFEYGLLYLFGRLFSLFHSAQDLAILYYQNPSIYLLLGRITTALFGVGTVYLTYLIGKRAFERTVGLLAALFLACSFGHIRDSHFAVPDIPMVFFLILAFYLTVKFWFTETNPLKLALLASLFTGIAVGFKYTAGLIAVPLFIALVLKRESLGKNWGIYIILLLLLIFIGFFVVCPYAILDFLKFKTSLIHLQYLDETGYFGLDPVINGFITYLRTLNWQLGTLMLLISIIGIFYSILRDKKTGLILFIFPILYYLIMGRSKLVFDRFMLPMLPFLTLASAIVIGELLRNNGWRKFWIPGIAILLILQPLANALYFDYLFTQKDTRTLAKEWIEINLPKDSKIITEGYGPPLTRYREFLKNQIPQEIIQEPYQVTELPKTGAATEPISYYREQGYEYLIISSNIYLRYWVRPDLYPEAIKYYQSLPKEAKLIATFSPFRKNKVILNRLEILPSTELYNRAHPGPILFIYQL
ncbi:MAG: glycosyltransferase family 39 protein [bacterium]|nr:glycosyltransferase family 39 protein [bacterium]